MEEAIQALVMNLERELLSPEVRRSAVRLGELLADEFVEFGASGRTYDKRSIIDSLVHTESTETFEVDNFRLVTCSDDSALVTYSCVARSGAGDVSRKSNRSSFWKLADGRWQMVFHQGTKTE
jgi:hypothetical protein